MKVKRAPLLIKSVIVMSMFTLSLSSAASTAIFFQKAKDNGGFDAYKAKPGVRMTNAILNGTAKRLGIKDAKNIKKFSTLVAKMESEGSGGSKALNTRGRPECAESPRPVTCTSASGAFQFVRGSVGPALTRMEKQASRYKTPMPAWAKKLNARYSDKKNPVSFEDHQRIITSLTYEQQEAIFLADITEKTIKINGKVQPGYGDELLRRIGDGDVEAMKTLYALGHHTQGDEHQATSKRAKMYFNKDQLRELD